MPSAENLNRSGDPAPLLGGYVVEPTQLESTEHLQKLLQQQFPPVPTLLEKPEQTGVISYRPSFRPPMAMLCVIDDGLPQGEWVRIRGDKIAIGRLEGGVVVSHDAMMSGRHAEISRELRQGQFRWMLTDLKSTNGTYVRIASSVLNHQQCLMVGGRRYRFDSAAQGVPTAASQSGADSTPHPSTVGWQAPKAEELIPSLIEITPQGDGQRIFLNANDNWIGTDRSQCNIMIENDPMISPRHAHLYKDTNGKWYIENAESKNGTWLRIERIPLGSIAQLQLGEQRFLFKSLDICGQLSDILIVYRSFHRSVTSRHSDCPLILRLEDTHEHRRS